MLSSPPTKMFLVACGCLYCAQCAPASVQGGCYTCKGPQGKILQVGKSLPQSVMEMFNKNEESLGKINKRAGFQKMHFDRTVGVLCRPDDDDGELERIEKETREKEVMLRKLDDELRGTKARVERLANAVRNLAIGEDQNRHKSPVTSPKNIGIQRESSERHERPMHGGPFKLF